MHSGIVFSVNTSDDLKCSMYRQLSFGQQNPMAIRNYFTVCHMVANFDDFE